MLRLNVLKCLNSQLQSKFLHKNVVSLNQQLQQNLTYAQINNIRKVHNLSFHKNRRLQHFEKDSGQKLTEEEYVAQLKNDPDTFGPRSGFDDELVDEGDLAEEKYFTEQPHPSQKLRTKQYADIIKDLLQKRKIKEAIDVVEVRMIKEDRVKPENYIYNLLLGGCGRVGYTKKAFSLFNDMKKRGLQVTAGTYTALFNACANSPWPLTDGLTRAKHLRDIMIEKQFDPNDTNYNAMIKAFGRCGDLPTAFSLVDEMIGKGFVIKDDTINFLLQACITDREAGFRHALLVWRRLVQRKIAPSIYTYNLMLRCIRDCGLGDLETTIDVINKLVDDKSNSLEVLDAPKQISSSMEDKNQETFLEIEQENERLLGSHNFGAPETSETVNLKRNNNDTTEIFNETTKDNDVQNIDDAAKPIEILTSKSYDTDTIENDATEIAKIDDTTKPIETLNIKNKLCIQDLDLRPNLMAETPYLGKVISLSEITKPEDRLFLVGGSVAFLKNMEDHNCKPDIKTVTQLLNTIPNTIHTEKDLLKYMHRNHLKPDIDFFNMLIKRRSLRCDYEGAREVLQMIRKIGYYPDLVTYGVLAMACKNHNEARELLEMIKMEGYRLNSEILGAMLHQACYNFNFSYVILIMNTCQNDEVQPNKKFFETLNKFYNVCKKQSNKKEFSPRNEGMFRVFKERYKPWLQEIKPDDMEDAHPWQQYRQETVGNDKYFKTKDTARFKARHASKFKVKTSAKHKQSVINSK